VRFKFCACRIKIAQAEACATKGGVAFRRNMARLIRDGLQMEIARKKYRQSEFSFRLFSDN
jgi:hypothetical protein